MAADHTLVAFVRRSSSWRQTSATLKGRFCVYTHNSLQDSARHETARPRRTKPARVASQAWLHLIERGKSLVLTSGLQITRPFWLRNTMRIGTFGVDDPGTSRIALCTGSEVNTPMTLFD
jgi:hypothetical protein